MGRRKKFVKADEEPVEVERSKIVKKKGLVKISTTAAELPLPVEPVFNPSPVKKRVKFVTAGKTVSVGKKNKRRLF